MNRILKSTTIRSILLVVMIFFLNQCKVDNIIKGQLTSMSPNTALVRNYQFILTIKGNDFTKSSVTYFNEKRMNTGFVDNSTLTCTVQTDDTIPKTESNGQSVVTVSYVDIYVHNVPDDTYSNSLEFALKTSPEFNQPVEINSNPGIYHLDAPQIKMDNEGVISMIYPGKPTDEYDGVHFSKSKDNGKTWDTFKRIAPLYDNPYQYPCKASMAIDSEGNIHVSYLEYKTWTAFYMIKLKNSDNWSNPRKIGHDLYLNYDFINKLLVGQNGRIFVIYRAFRQLYITSSDDFGLTWSDSVKFNTKSSVDRLDAIIMSDSTIAVAWNSFDADINLSTSIDSGETWNTINKDIDNIKVYIASVSAYENKVFLSYSLFGTDNKISYVINTTDNGNTWSNPVKINDGGIFNFLQTDKVGNLHAVWKNNSLYYRRSIDGGLNWSEPVIATEHNIQNNAINFIESFGIDPNGYPLLTWVILRDGYELKFMNCSYSTSSNN